MIFKIIPSYRVTQRSNCMNTAFGLLAESGGVIDRLQGYGTAAEQFHDGDYWGSVGIITITGILVVFLILAILIFFFWLMGTVFKAVDKSRAAKKAAADEAAKAEAAKAAAAAPAVEEAPEEDEITDDDELIAVISAAVAAYTDGENYTITSVRRHTDRRTRSAWSMAGLGKNMKQF